MRPAAVHLWLAALGCIAPFAAIAHEGPEHEIEELRAHLADQLALIDAP